MNRSNFIKSLIGIPFIGAIASDLVAKETVKEVASISVPKINNLTDIKNPVEGQLFYNTKGANQGLWVYNKDMWILISYRGSMMRYE